MLYNEYIYIDAQDIYIYSPVQYIVYTIHIFVARCSEAKSLNLFLQVPPITIIETLRDLLEALIRYIYIYMQITLYHYRLNIQYVFMVGSFIDHYFY